MGNSSPPPPPPPPPPYLPTPYHIDLESSAHIAECSWDSTYSLLIGHERIRCKVDHNSTVTLVGVKSASSDYSNFPPHCGLLFSNSFHLTKTGYRNTPYNYCLADALIKVDTNTVKVRLSFFDSKSEVFTLLKSVHKAYSAEVYQAETSGIESSAACSTIVSRMKEELCKPFDPQWKSRSTANLSESEDKYVTNCAFFACRIYIGLAPSYDNAADSLVSAFSRLGMHDVSAKYVNALKQ